MNLSALVPFQLASTIFLAFPAPISPSVLLPSRIQQPIKVEGSHQKQVVMLIATAIRSLIGRGGQECMRGRPTPPHSLLSLSPPFDIEPY